MSRHPFRVKVKRAISVRYISPRLSEVALALSKLHHPLQISPNFFHLSTPTSTKCSANSSATLSRFLKRHSLVKLLTTSLILSTLPLRPLGTVSSLVHYKSRIAWASSRLVLPASRRMRVYLSYFWSAGIAGL